MESFKDKVVFELIIEERIYFEYVEKKMMLQEK